MSIQATSPIKLNTGQINSLPEDFRSMTTVGDVTSNTAAEYWPRYDERAIAYRRHMGCDFKSFIVVKTNGQRDKIYGLCDDSFKFSSRSVCDINKSSCFCN